MTTRTLAVVSAGLGVPSSTRLLADQLAAASTQALQQRGGTAEVEVVELRQYARDLADNLVSGFANANLRTALDRVRGADALIAVTPVFSASYSGLFKTFVDVLGQDALTGMPVVIGATAGTTRHSLVLDHAMRPLFTYLRSFVVPTGVFAAPEDWAGGDATSRALADRVERAAGELAEMVMTRGPRRLVDPFEEPVGFEQLLAGR